MSWHVLKVACEGTHHILPNGEPAYDERFDEVLKFHAPGLAPVRRGSEAWHVCPDGSPAYDRRFLRTFGYYAGRSAVVDLDGWHHITSEGVDVYPERYSWCGNFQEGRCSVRDHKGSYWHIDVEGRSVYAAQWRYVGDFRDGFAVVQGRDGLSTHVGLGGAVVHGQWFLDLDVYHKGFARARDVEGWMHIDMNGLPLYSRRFAAVEPFYNGQARIERFDGAFEVIDESGSTIIELRPSRRSDFAALSSDMVGFWRTQTIAAAVSLGVIEALPSSEDEVNNRCGLRKNGARRLLWALSELGLVRKSEENWELTPRGMYLRKEHPLTLADASLEYAGPFTREWERLGEALAAGSDWVPSDVFAIVGSDTSRRDGHHRMLQSYARHDYISVPSSLGLNGEERIIDAAGGLGTLGRFIIDEYPKTVVTVLERPEVVEQALRTLPPMPGLEFRSVDIFGPWGLSADVVILSRVLHDWEDDAAVTILSHARAALPFGGRLFVIEMLRPKGGSSGALCDLHLLLATGGRERSTDEYTQLFEETGFRMLETRTIGSLVSILVGVAL